KIKQEFPGQSVSDVSSEVAGELGKIKLHERVRPCASVAITAGSRGIKNITAILKSVADTIKAAGACPFVVGAMGSHGGGTSAGQKKVLSTLGITEEAIGCPVHTSDEAVEVGSTPSGARVYCDRAAWSADGIIVVNRVKPHTTFHGPVESGLFKMMVVGLGKAGGAAAIHRLGPHRMAQELLEMGRIYVRSGKVLAGLAIVENSREETAAVEAAAPDGVEEMEKRLLQLAYRLLPRLPAERLDFLVMCEMGKNISGTGMDSNVIGRTRIAGVPEPETPFIARVVVLDLTDESHGNATGLGLADFTTRRLVDKMDAGATYLNCITSGNVQRAMLPIIMADDCGAIEAAIKSLTGADPANLKGAVIKNTLDLERLWVTEAVAASLAGREDVKVLSEPEPLAFSNGRLILDFD
ncbi:MAG: nickel pincer cofactor-dependent isomerase, group 22, partial [Eubacteriales bacterium]